MPAFVLRRALEGGVDVTRPSGLFTWRARLYWVQIQHMGPTAAS